MEQLIDSIKKDHIQNSYLLTLRLFTKLKIKTAIKIKQIMEQESAINKKLSIHCLDVKDSKQDYKEVLS